MDILPKPDNFIRVALIRPSDMEVAWLAGLLEGEGCFGMARKVHPNKIYLYPSISLAMTDQDVVTRAASLMGRPYIRTKAPQQEHYKMQYTFVILGAGAARWMRRLQPFMGERRSGRITEILAEHEQEQAA